MTGIPVHYADTAPAALANGWAPVPLHAQTKVPNRKGWPQRILMSPERLRCEVMRELSWRGDADRRGCACGIVVPSDVLFVDVDIIDAETNAKVRAIIGATLKMTQPELRMARIGRSPKFLMGFGVTPGTVRSRKLGGVELFCGSGQIAAFGVHEKTGQPYAWGPRSPLNTRPEELAQVTAGQVEAFVAACVREGVLTPPDALPGAAKGVSGSGGAHGPNGVQDSLRTPYAATLRLRALYARHDRRIKPAVTALIGEVGRTGHDRHDALVAVCGSLVHHRWLNDQINEFVVPLINTAFGDGDWSVEVDRAIAHARNRDTARRGEERAARAAGTGRAAP
jgi:hypothetical protein